MRYPIEKYDTYGFIKVPLWLWLGWILLARAWLVFIMAAASRTEGGQILEIIYPDTDTLYLGLIMGAPSVVLMWLVGMRNDTRHYINQITARGWFVTLALTLLQLVQVGYDIYCQAGLFHWSLALTCVLLVWFAIYLINTRYGKACFSIPVLLQQEQR